MNLFADYIQPLTYWLQTNPHWALFITFTVSLTESLAIIGSLVPGSVTMTAIGILAGSGVMRIDLTLLAAILGAVCGDSLSYALGYFYSDQLTEIWPFKKYPHWLKYGKDFFSRHGGKSVLIGRFVGPLRSIIPVIAGIMRMKQWRFLIANVISAIGWSLLYVMPGVLIGAASHELSAESATRLFVLILIALAGIWLATMIIKWLIVKLNSYLKNNLHRFWTHLRDVPIFNTIYKILTPANEENHYPTAALTLLTLFGFVCLCVLILLSVQNVWISYLNLPVNLFFQGFNSKLLQSFFIICSQLTSVLTMFCFFLFFSLWFIYQKNYKPIFYMVGVILSSTCFALLLAYYIPSPRPQGLLITMSGSAFPAINILVATAFYGFILFWINNKYFFITNILRSIFFVILGLSGLAAIYLNDYWFIDVITAYFAGAAICLSAYLIYRKNNFNTLKDNQPGITLCLLFAGIISATSLSSYLNFQELSYAHTPYNKEFTLNKSLWWNQKKPILPLYQLSRIGNKISLLNIQYAGDLQSLKDDLEQQGWKTHTESFVTKLLMRINNKATDIKLPLLAQLYQNKRPQLIMTYKVKESSLILILTIWESNYTIHELNKPIWIGSVHQNFRGKEKESSALKNQEKLINPVTYLLPALKDYTVRRIALPPTLISNSTFPTTSMIFLIKEIDK